jgi:hypothetical protein
MAEHVTSASSHRLCTELMQARNVVPRSWSTSSGRAHDAMQKLGAMVLTGACPVHAHGTTLETLTAYTVLTPNLRPCDS